jgi:hypothetical protein
MASIKGALPNITKLMLALYVAIHITLVQLQTFAMSTLLVEIVSSAQISKENCFKNLFKVIIPRSLKFINKFKLPSCKLLPNKDDIELIKKALHIFFIPHPDVYLHSTKQLNLKNHTLLLNKHHFSIIQLMH